ncbi:hypothetical protein [Methanosarcina horonobensis]|uniref:hypothetical protein n=1 Tax=Methanosarcina horonobensis TaxID=418008 RepID=UPI000A610DC4|nr:hypothetical protein [Methanosarcina horonobensis]
MQLTGCKTGQLSFHLKKLDYLVEQDELKRYRLSEKGKEDVEMILPMLGNGEKEKSSSWDNFSGEEDGVQLGCAFKQFWDSLGLLIFSSLVAVKRGILYALDGLKTGTLMLAEKKEQVFQFCKNKPYGRKLRNPCCREERKGWTPQCKMENRQLVFNYSSSRDLGPESRSEVLKPDFLLLLPDTGVSSLYSGCIHPYASRI